MANQGIMHAAHRAGGDSFCKTRRSIMSVSVAEFRTMNWTPCKRCAAKIAKLDAKAAAKAAKQ